MYFMTIYGTRMVFGYVLLTFQDTPVISTQIMDTIPHIKLDIKQLTKANK
jgi:hypothetical protein